MKILDASVVTHSFLRVCLVSYLSSVNISFIMHKMAIIYYLALDEVEIK